MTIRYSYSSGYNWTKTFVILPKKTISGKTIWCQTAYKRKVWVLTRITIEPEIEYGTFFDVLKHQDDVIDISDDPEKDKIIGG